jgi:hypothetical protein
VAKSEKPEVISKSEAARRWGVSPASVAKYIKRGMPVRSDRKLNWSAVDAWRRDSNTPEHSGSFHARHRRNPATVPPMPVPPDEPLTTAAEVLNHLHGPGMVRLVEIAKALGLKPAQQVAAVHIACAWIFASVGESTLEQCGPNWAPVDYSGLDEIRLTSRQGQQAERLSEIAERSLGLEGGAA